MAATANPDIGTGSSVTLTGTFLAKILNIEVSGMSRESIPVSHLGTTVWREFLPGDLADPGELVVEVLASVTQVPPITSAAQTITVAFPGGDTWAASGFMTNFDLTVPLEDRIVGTATFKMTGPWTAA